MSPRDYRSYKEVVDLDLTGKAALWLAAAKLNEADFNKLAQAFPAEINELNQHFSKDPEIQGTPLKEVREGVYLNEADGVMYEEYDVSPVPDFDD